MNRNKLIIRTVILSIVLGNSFPTQNIHAEQSSKHTISLYSSSFDDNVINPVLNSINVLQSQLIEDAVTEAALNDLTSQLMSISVPAITDRFEILQLGAVLNLAADLLDTISVTDDISESYNQAKAAVEISIILVDYKKINDSSMISDIVKGITPSPQVTPTPSNSSSPTGYEAQTNTSSPSGYQTQTNASSQSFTQIPSVAQAPSTTGPSETSTSSKAKVPTATPKPSADRYIEQINYRGGTLTVEDVKSWNWKKGGTIQVGGYLCDFGMNKATGLLWIQNPRLRNYKNFDADITVAMDQWLNLPEFKHGKYKYQPVYRLWNQMLKRTSNMILKSSDPDRPIAIAGDTFVDSKGKKTKLTALLYDEDIVVGYGQKLDLFSGMRCEDGLIKPGDLGDNWYGDSQYSSQIYLLASNGEGHFSWDWSVISYYEASLAKKVKKPKANQIVGYWTKYNAKLKKWEWIGPEFDSYFP